jgi:hypothetical protein
MLLPYLSPSLSLKCYVWSDIIINSIALLPFPKNPENRGRLGRSRAQIRLLLQPPLFSVLLVARSKLGIL